MLYRHLREREEGEPRACRERAADAAADGTIVGAAGAADAAARGAPTPLAPHVFGFALLRPAAPGAPPVSQALWHCGARSSAFLAAKWCSASRAG